MHCPWNIKRDTNIKFIFKKILLKVSREINLESSGECWCSTGHNELLIHVQTSISLNFPTSSTVDNGRSQEWPKTMNLNRSKENCVVLEVVEMFLVSLSHSTKSGRPSLKYCDPNLCPRLLLSPVCANQPHIDGAWGRKKEVIKKKPGSVCLELKESHLSVQDETTPGW